jgi:Ca2+-binding RTX toxin-like protein
VTTYIGTDLNDKKDVTGSQHAVGLEGNDNLDDGYNGPGETLEGNNDNDHLFFYGSAAGSIYGGGDNDALFGASGSDYLDGWSDDDYLDGNYVSDTNADNDELYGGGGIDGLYGRGGDDFLYGGNGSDKGQFQAAGSSTYLTNTLTAFIAGLYGGDSNDHIDGGAGNDDLHGGLGNDILQGGEDSDTFFFDSALTPVRNVDTILDFEVHIDKIALSKTIFGSSHITDGALSHGELHIGKGAHDKNDTIIYNPKTGAVSYDDDGNHHHGDPAVRFATLQKHLDLHNSDFIIVA